MQPKDDKQHAIQLRGNDGGIWDISFLPLGSHLFTVPSSHATDTRRYPPCSLLTTFTVSCFEDRNSMVCY